MQRGPVKLVVDGHMCNTVWRNRKHLCFLSTGIPIYTEHTIRR